MPRSVLKEILSWTQEQLPHEACGLLIGRLGGHVAIVEIATTARNLEARADRFRVHPEDQLAAHLAAEARGSVVIGAWHSHPGKPPIPSELDHQGALRGSIQLIAGVGTGGTTVTAWAQEGTGLAPCELISSKIDGTDL